jgi:peptide-methionine (S)-S-oxide reductase
MEKYKENQQLGRLETIVLGAGCFWCTEAVYLK